MSDYWFDERAADAAVDFFRVYLRHTRGEWAGRPFVLEPWQEHEIIRPLFGWKRADGTRRYRRCYVEVPRKNGKTELAAGVAILLEVGDGEPGGEGYAIAHDENQSKIVFAAAQTMVAYSEDLQNDLQSFKTSIYCPALNASFKPLPGRPTGKHGLNPSFLIGDEVHEWPTDRLYTFVRQGMASRRQPLEFLITTAGEKRGFGWEMHDLALKVRDGIIEDPEMLVVMYGADADDDWADPDVWAKVNPNLGVSVKREYLESECRRAQESPRLENDFKRYHLNMWVEQLVRWLPMDKWDLCDGEPEAEDRWRTLFADLKGRECWGGLDLSTTTDVTALSWLFPPVEEGERWKLLCRFWVPRDTITIRVRRDRAPYDLWEQRGALQATPGNIVDYRWITDAVMADAEAFRVNGLAIDRWNASQTAIELQDEGLPVVLFGQGYASMSAPSKELERMVLGGLLDHGGHPVLRWMASNAAIKQDPAGNIKPAKDASTERIDGIVSTIEAIGLAIGEDDKPIQVEYERGQMFA